MMAWDSELNGVHREIAASTAKRLSVLAGPGTGKTSFGLMRRVQRLLEEGVDPRSVLLISFTRTAAHDLKDKLSSLEVPGAGEVTATTLHSFCLKMLQQDDVFRSTGRTPRILLDHEQVHMLHDLGPDHGSFYERREKLNELVAGWDDGTNPHPGLAELPEDRAFERELRSWMLHHEAILIGEVIPLAYMHLRNDPLNEVFGRYSHILVDEYQDLNKLEQRLVELLSGGSETSLFIVGDDDQSIYGFRHAHPEGILSFHTRRDVESYSLDTCGRCPSQVIRMANSLIAHAPDRDKSPLVPRDPDRSGDVAIVQWATLEKEIQGIRDAIVYDVRSGRFEPGDILVLCNSQEIGRLFRKRINEAGIDAHSFYSQEPLRRHKAQEAFSILQLVVRDDSAALRVALGGGVSNRRTEAYRKLRTAAESLNITENELLGGIISGEIEVNFNAPSMVKRYEEIQRRIEQLKTLEVPDLVDSLFPAADEDIHELRELIQDCAKISESAEELLRLVTERISQLEVPEYPNYVRVMSLHKSKGLTSKCVYITTALDQIIPYHRSSASGLERQQAVNDGRRLMYVAVTRAAQKLVVSFPAFMPRSMVQSMGIDAGDSKGGEVRMHASSYINEFGNSAPKAEAGDQWLKRDRE